jgi:hypothetical protein
MLLNAAVLVVLLGSGEERRRSVAYRSGCAAVGLPTRARFEEYSEESLGTLNFSCSLSLCLDAEDVTPEKKFERLALQAQKSEKWAEELFRPMAMLDWERFLGYVYQRAASFGPIEWGAVSRATRFRQKAFPEMKEPPRKLTRLFFEQAQHGKIAWQRAWMASWFRQPWATLEQALTLARQFPKENVTDPRAVILAVLLSHDDPRTNKVVRDFLRGPVDLEVLESMYVGYPPPAFVDENRYDFLPELRALRARLVAEKDMLKTYEARQGLESLDEMISDLEKKKEENAPICPARKGGK